MSWAELEIEGAGMMSTRPPEPQSVIQWRELVQSEPPRCCHTCDHYGKDGHCAEFDMKPPADFAGSIDACELWAEEVPF